MPQFPRDGPLGRDPDRSRDSDTPPHPYPQQHPWGEAMAGWRAFLRARHSHQGVSQEEWGQNL